MQVLQQQSHGVRRSGRRTSCDDASCASPCSSGFVSPGGAASCGPPQGNGCRYRSHVRGIADGQRCESRRGVRRWLHGSCHRTRLASSWRRVLGRNMRRAACTVNVDACGVRCSATCAAAQCAVGSACCVRGRTSERAASLLAFCARRRGSLFVFVLHTKFVYAVLHPVVHPVNLR